MLTDPVTRRYQTALEMSGNDLREEISSVRERIMGYSSMDTEEGRNRQLEARAEVLCLQAALTQNGLDPKIPEWYFMSPQKKVEKYLGRARRIYDQLGQVSF